MLTVIAAKACPCWDRAVCFGYLQITSNGAEKFHPGPDRSASAMSPKTSLDVLSIPPLRSPTDNFGNSPAPLCKSDNVLIKPLTTT